MEAEYQLTLLVKLIQSGFGGLLGTVGGTWAGDSGSMAGPTSAPLLSWHNLSTSFFKM